MFFKYTHDKVAYKFQSTFYLTPKNFSLNINLLLGSTFGLEPRKYFVRIPHFINISINLMILSDCFSLKSTTEIIH